MHGWNVAASSPLINKCVNGTHEYGCLHWLRLRSVQKVQLCILSDFLEFNGEPICALFTVRSYNIIYMAAQNYCINYKLSNTKTKFEQSVNTMSKCSVFVIINCVYVLLFFIPQTNQAMVEKKINYNNKSRVSSNSKRIY